MDDVLWYANWHLEKRRQAVAKFRGSGQDPDRAAASAAFIDTSTLPLEALVSMVELAAAHLLLGMASEYCYLPSRLLDLLEGLAVVAGAMSRQKGSGGGAESRARSAWWIWLENAKHVSGCPSSLHYGISICHSPNRATPGDKTGWDGRDRCR